MRLIRLLLAPLLLFHSFAPAATNRLSIHPNIEIAVQAITAGPHGLLWLAAEDGLYRFDGLHYHRPRGYPFTSASHVAATADGTLWIGADQGLVRFADRFEIMLKEPVLGLLANEDEVVVRTASRFSRVRLDGSMTPIEPKGGFRLAKNDSGDIFYIVGRQVYVLKNGAVRAELLMNVPEGLTGSDWEVVPGSGDVVWFADRHHAFWCRNREGKLTQHWLRKYPAGGPTLAQGRSGGVWLLSRALARLHPLVEFRDLPNTGSGPPVRAGYEDDRGRLWTALTGLGLLEAVPDETWERWSSKHLRGDSVSSIVRNSTGDLVAAAPRGGLWKLSRSEGRWEQLRRDERRFKSILPLPDGTLLVTTMSSGVAHFSGQGRSLRRFSYTEDGTNDYRDIHRDGDGRIWIAAETTIFQLGNESGSFSLLPVHLPGNGHRLVAGLEVDSTGRIWAGYAGGVARRNSQGNWEQIRSDRRIQYVRALTFGDTGSDDEIWLAYQHGRRFARLIRTGETWQVLDFDEDPSSAPAETVFVHRDSRGWIWRGTKTGVYVCDGLHVEPSHWLRLDVETGLAGQRLNQNGFLEDTDGSIWLAGEEGVTHLWPNASWFQPPAMAPPPQITRVVADEREYVILTSVPERYPTGLKTLTIEAGSLLATPFREAPFQWRLPEIDTGWKPMRNGTLELHNPRDGKYRLEIDHAGAQSRSPRVYVFRIGAAPFPLSWPQMITGFGGLALLGAFFRRTLLYQRAHYWLLKLFHHARRNRPNQVEDLKFEKSSSSGILAARYLLVRRVSRGGFSTVYEARDLSDANRTVAVKVFHRRVTESTWVKGRFAHEVASLRGIKHPGVVPLLDSWVNADGRACLVMPLLSGPTLRDALATRPLEPARIVRLIRGLGDALAAIHSRGVVHRDLKPDNILLIAEKSGSETPVLVDFGNAGLIGMNEGLARTELLTGSIDYMAPEQLTKHYSSSSDIYSFGVIILEILTGSRLADLHHAVSDPGFEEEVALLIAAATNYSDTRSLTSKLAQAYRADPAARPTRADEWAHELIETISGSPNPEDEGAGIFRSGPSASSGAQN